MKRKRRHLTAEFKARIALEALKGVKSAAEIAQENEIAPAQISEWKREVQERMSELFESEASKKKRIAAAEKQKSQLERKVGQLVIEKDFLVKKCVELGIDPSEKA